MNSDAATLAAGYSSVLGFTATTDQGAASAENEGGVIKQPTVSGAVRSRLAWKGRKLEVARGGIHRYALDSVWRLRARH